MSVNNEQEQEVNEKDNEISLIDLFVVLKEHKKLIALITGIGTLGAVIFCIISIMLPSNISPLPNKYTSSANMLINNGESSKNGLSSMLSSSGIGSLIGLSGISEGFSYSSLALYLCSSKSFLDSVIKEFDLVERWKIKKDPQTTSRKELEKVLKADFDETNGMFTISCKDIDPEFAMKIVQYSVEWLEKKFLELGLDKNQVELKNLEENISSSYNEMINLKNKISSIENTGNTTYQDVITELSFLEIELAAQTEVYKNLKTQYELLKIKIQSETPFFQIIEYPEIPETKSEPSRGIICIIVLFASLFISIFVAFLHNAICNIKKDPVAMKKLGYNKK